MKCGGRSNLITAVPEVGEMCFKMPKDSGMQVSLDHRDEPSIFIS